MEVKSLMTKSHLKHPYDEIILPLPSYMMTITSLLSVLMNKELCLYHVR